MKKGIILFLFIAFLNGCCLAKAVRLGVINPTPRNLEKIFYLIEKDYIDVDSLEIIGIYHESQSKSMESTHAFIAENGYTHISFLTLKNMIPLDSLFMNNACTTEFRDIFLKTDGLLFLGGDDILPGIYGEKTFLTTELIAQERNWEISFLFHLTGGSQNGRFTPFLEEKPAYVILGICLGMQEMNVANGGTLHQDIPFQIYKKKDYESIIDQEPEKQHKNYLGRIQAKNSGLHFHHIKITPDCMLDFEQVRRPLVTSVHHQSVKKLGKNYQTIATSMDHKVIEAMSNTQYANVYGVQFHPELPILYEQEAFSNAKNEVIVWDAKDKSFHTCFWKDFSNRLRSAH